MNPSTGTGTYDRAAAGRELTARRAAELTADPFAGLPGAGPEVTQAYDVPEAFGLTAAELADLVAIGAITEAEAAAASA